jgi:cytochrome c-type biogenesis protein CcmF
LDPADYPENATIAVRANLDFINKETLVPTTVTPLFAIIRENDSNVVLSEPLALDGSEIVVYFTNVNPNSEEIELRIEGTVVVSNEEWILLTIEKKPFVSVVWLGTFLLMAGFSVSIMRRWKDQKRREENEMKHLDQSDENKEYA